MRARFVCFRTGSKTGVYEHGNVPSVSIKGGHFYDSVTEYIHAVCWIRYSEKGKDKSKGKGPPCTGTEAQYRPYGP